MPPPQVDHNEDEGDKALEDALDRPQGLLLDHRVSAARQRAVQ